MKRNGSGRSAPKPTNGKHPIQTLSAFKPQKRNVNLGKPHGLAALDKSIRRDGYSAPMVAAADGEIFAGSKRLETSADVFGPDVKPIVIHSDGTRPIVHVRDDIPDADDPRAKRLGVADNLIAAMDWNPDGELLAALIGEDKFIEEMARQENASLKALAEYQSEQELVDAEPQIDRAAELNKKWKVKTGDLWRIGAHRLLCGDSTVRENVERVMGGEKADCVFTSPPYAVGVDYGKEYHDTIENLRAMLPALADLWRDCVVCDGGFAVINFGDIAPARNVANSAEPCEYPVAVEYWPIFRSAGWLLWSRRIWCKPNARVNSLWCIGSNRAATDWEHLWTWRKEGDPIIKRVDGNYSSALGWIDTSLMHGVDIGKEEHGAGMALGIVDWMLTVHSRPDSIIHEPFTGTGTTLISCQNLSRRCRAIEISPAYCAVTLQRMADAFPGLPIERVSA